MLVVYPFHGRSDFMYEWGRTVLYISWTLYPPEYDYHEGAHQLMCQYDYHKRTEVMRVEYHLLGYRCPELRPTCHIECHQGRPYRNDSEWNTHEEVIPLNAAKY